MQKMSIEAQRLHLKGPTMGTSWSVAVDGLRPSDLPDLQAALQNAVQQVDAQMSTWTPTSDLMQFNAAPLNAWAPLPKPLLQVLAAGLDVSRATDGAFELNVGNAVRAWGFGAAALDLAFIRSASQGPLTRAIDALELDFTQGAAKKTAPLALDLSGIAKGYAVDRLAEVLLGFDSHHALCAIDGEVRAIGPQASGDPWSVAIETPTPQLAQAHSVLALADGAVATSGDYRHFVEVKGQRLSHTIDPRRGSPAVQAPASVSVLAQNCMQADAMATALMVMGPKAGHIYATNNRISALFLLREADTVTALGTGAFDQNQALWSDA